MVEIGKLLPEAIKVILTTLPDNKKDVLVDKMSTAGISFSNIDPEWLKLIIHQVDQYTGDRLSDFVEGLLAMNIAYTANILGDGKVDKSDIPNFKKLVNGNFALLKPHLTDWQWDALSKVLDAVWLFIDHFFPIPQPIQ